jgi:ubiquinone/menaquinone biosynthesis C-methylase UbiE
MALLAHDSNKAGRDAWVAAQAAVLPPGARVLDLGAGPCRYAELFRHCRYVATDFAHSPNAFRQLDVVADIAHSPFGDAAFDAILCTEVLEHLANPVAAVADMARLLHSSGKVLLTAPLGSGLHQMPHHYYGGFTPVWYRSVLTRFGFRDIRIEANGGFYKHYGQESQRFSGMLNPRHCNGTTPCLKRVLLASTWMATLPLLRMAIPAACEVLDALDVERAFTVGYFVTALRS